MNKLEELKDELNKVVSLAKEFNVNHTEMAKIVGIGYEYARAIRNDAEKFTNNTEENCALVQKMINAYRNEIRRKKELLKTI